MLLDLLPQLLSLLLFTPLAMLWGGCCCEASCTFFTDTFTRANDDAPGAYTEVSGDWDIASFKLSTSSTSGVLIADDEHPDGDPNVKVTVTVRSATNGARARIILDYVDTSNYWFAEMEIGVSSYVKIYQRSSGTDTEMGSIEPSLSTSTDYEFCASISSEGFIYASVLNVSDSGTSSTGSFSSPTWGLGTGSVVGTITFDDLTASITGEECPPCVLCEKCTGNLLPNTFKAVVSGITNDSCSNCATYNGTFYLALEAAPVGTSCARYKFVIPSANCFLSALLVDRISMVLAGPVADFSVFIGDSTDVSRIATYNRNISGTVNCLEMVDVNIPVTGSIQTTCEEASSTCLLTAQ